ncbi:MAG: VanZ family protein [Chloroflexi bacterium]|nr:VanZ family protein [Chloroflexota bacterium]
MPQKIASIVPRWFPALIIMLAIFAFSSQPSYSLPSFSGWDSLVKKGGHFIGYGLLALSYLHALKYDRKRIWLAWLLSVFYAATDEFHQSFVPGRNASIFDVLIFDNLGAVFALWIYSHYWSKQKK